MLTHVNITDHLMNAKTFLWYNKICKMFVTILLYASINENKEERQILKPQRLESKVLADVAPCLRTSVRFIHIYTLLCCPLQESFKNIGLHI